MYFTMIPTDRVVRPIGLRRRHMAVPNGVLDEIAAGEGVSTGIEPLVQAIEREIITADVCRLIRPNSDAPVWPVALAWLMRDQECRLDDVLDWRSPISDSDSPLPASGREKTPRLEAVRAFLLAITAEEQAVQNQSLVLEEQRRVADQELGHRKWETERLQARILTRLQLSDANLPNGSLLIDHLRQVSAQRVTAAVNLPAGSAIDLEKVRDELEGATSEWSRLISEQGRIEGSMPVVEKLIQQYAAEIPGFSASAIEAASPICPICEVPIDRALAEGCKVSHKLPDAEACRARWQQRKNDLQAEQQRLTGLRNELAQIQGQIALAKQRRDRLSAQATVIEKARDARESAWYAARRTQDEVERLAELIGTLDDLSRKLRGIVDKLQAERERLGSHLNKQLQTFGRLTEKFDPIIRALVGQNAKGGVSLSRAGLDLTVDMGGNRSTVAIDSLKVLAFDLAALCLSIEGHARIPALLLHDSPREGDLGESIYHKIFHLIRQLETIADQPPFQYILTTTTRPPNDFLKEPWLRLTLRGESAQERFLGRDL